MNNKKNTFFDFCIEYAIALFLFLLIGVFSVYGINEAKQAQREEAIRIAEESIMRGAISCYALEGFYPPTYDYLKENYDICIDEENYTVFYDIFASNMMPDITVVEK